MRQLIIKPELFNPMATLLMLYGPVPYIPNKILNYSTVIDIASKPKQLIYSLHSAIASEQNQQNKKCAVYSIWNK